jgi:hypothetical protein
MLNKIKIGPKLIGGFLVVACIALIVGVVGISNIKAIAKADTYLVSVRKLAKLSSRTDVRDLLFNLCSTNRLSFQSK